MTKAFPITWATAEGIELPKIEPKILDVAVFPVHEKILRTICTDVDENVTRSEEFRKHIAFMLCTLYNSQMPGIGLASNQVGLPLRVIVIDSEWPNTKIPNPKVLLNPFIAFEYGEQDSKEGCLSIPLDYSNIVKRANEIEVGAITLDWEPISFKSIKLEAAVIQHEIDHLNGKLFIDHLSNLKRKMYFNKLTKYAKKNYYRHKNAGLI